jgi:hypothetical protein
MPVDDARQDQQTCHCSSATLRDYVTQRGWKTALNVGFVWLSEALDLLTRDCPALSQSAEPRHADSLATCLRRGTVRWLLSL